MIKDLAHFVMVAQGKAMADVVIKDANVYQSFLGTFTRGDIAIDQGHVAGIGSYEGHETIDAHGRYATPSFIDGHVHIESSMLCPREFARAVVPLGTLTVVTDPHEIANVAGVAGIRYMMDAAKNLPMDTYFMLPSCVPSTPLEDSGATLSAAELRPLLDEPMVLGLAEFMNVPGVLLCDAQAYQKLTMKDDLKIEGHAPGVMGSDLSGYAAAGITSDHECVTADEARARLAAGMYLEIREGSAARNYRALSPVIDEHTAPYCLLVTDDRHPADILERGHINSIVRDAVKSGLDLGVAINMATINPACYFGLRDTGVIAPHYHADILLFDDLESFVPSLVMRRGKVVAEKGGLVCTMPEINHGLIEDSVRLAPFSASDLVIHLPGGKANVMELVPHQLITKKAVMDVKTENGLAVADAEHDILKLAVFERHHATGQVGRALVKGFGLKAGAIASTVGHDSHNLTVIGASDVDMIAAARELERIHGGFAIARDGKVLGSLALPIGGLMTTSDARYVASEAAKLVKIGRDLGVNEAYDPLMTLAFLSLPVIPALKLTDRGLVDVTAGRIISVAAE